MVIPRNRLLRLNMNEKLFTGTLNHNQSKQKPFIAGLHVYIILLYNSVFKIHSIFNIEEHILKIAYRNVVNYIVFIVHV